MDLGANFINYDKGKGQVACKDLDTDIANGYNSNKDKDRSGGSNKDKNDIIFSSMIGVNC